MAGATEGSKTKKRKRSSSASFTSSTDPFAGIFTRRRSEIYLHRNRSGHVRSYSTPARKRNTNVQLPEWCRGNPRASNSEVFDYEIVRTSIKDLRARRVFSPASDECYSNGNCDVVEDTDFQKPQLAGVFCKSEAEENEGSEVVIGFDFQCTENHQLTEAEGTRELSVESFQGEKRCNGESEILSGGDDFTEGVQTTPPDTDVFCKSKVEDNGESTVEFDLQSRDCIAENPSSIRVSDSGNCVGEDFPRIDMDKKDQPRNTSRTDGLVPSSRLKLFKTPNSFSYRRLLPFLMDIAKDNSTSLEIRQCEEVEKSLEENPVPPFSVSLSQEIPLVVKIDPLPVGPPLGCLASAPPGKRREMVPLDDSSGIQGSNLVSLGQPIIEPPLQCLPESNQRTIAANADLKMLQFPETGVTVQLTEVCLGQPENNLHPEVSGGGACSSGDWFQTIPPDTDVLCKLEAEENGGSRVGFDPQCAKKHQLPEMEDVRELLVESSQGDTKSNGDAKIFGGGDDSTEEWVQTTPPDDNVFCKLEVEGNGGNTAEFDLQSRGYILENPLSRRASDNGGCVGKEFSNDMDKNNCPHTKSRMDGLIPCSRLKLFKTPNSFGYRRLLPFLMDIAKDNSSALKIHHCEKVEKSGEEKPVPSQEIPMEGVNTDPLPVGHHLGCLASTPPEIAREAPLDGSSEIHGSSLWSPGQPSIEPPLQNLPERIFMSTSNDSMIITPPSSFSECLSQVQQVMSNNSSELETRNAMGLIEKADLPAKRSISPQATTIKQDALQTSYSSTGIEEDCMAAKFHADVKPQKMISFCEGSTQFEALVPSLKPVVGPTKGILKRYPRGCRGPCTCLNCSSFRLHAERSFEFSRNQLQDAKEVAALLLTELNCLRNLLGKCADASKEHAVFEVSQVKEACTNASRVEELAKARLLQMNHDLGIHCRMTIKDSKQ
ncbi:uncharacterized protein LOC122089890 isoform X2 [Macadamia integrifolia]|uniref:uncharacterized protein LOC122089890 isoform X2 n=1 Tax=Macadamia integrifolia TaxID=60698 RepID=UPI001C4EA6C3|nr:uncharacterized protein LOC122089890 isoform X2 [Macadamia integrifolia]